MKCERCGREFEEKDIHLSHDVPKYIGGKDSNGRHYFCKKCYDIYEKMVFAFMTKPLPEKIKEEMRKRAKEFAGRFFHG